MTCHRISSSLLLPAVFSFVFITLAIIRILKSDTPLLTSSKSFLPEHSVTYSYYIQPTIHFPCLLSRLVYRPSVSSFTFGVHQLSRWAHLLSYISLERPIDIQNSFQLFHRSALISTSKQIRELFACFKEFHHLDNFLPRHRIAITRTEYNVQVIFLSLYWVMKRSELDKSPELPSYSDNCALTCSGAIRISFIPNGCEG
ncbi:hypothetical protein GQ43DRAFT_107380 [Delitschia confertaspora ATCC 74209]|uniref:Uncharacterized protein n=1 Tax=Delitschia confertaspora ATCC 74209 TaxID=1513339 RepID=A0A9P4JID4_9PLEO|nr:hypothetical protein GQ43DRAFT_107380 [Delitschia confertaspora ATCC 74209]